MTDLNKIRGTEEICQADPYLDKSQQIDSEMICEAPTNANDVIGMASEDVCSPENITKHLKYFVKHASWAWGQKANDKYWRRVLVWSPDPDKASQSVALRDMVRNPSQYAYDCANFVYFAQFYAILEIIGDDERFNDVDNVPYEFLTYNYSFQDCERFRQTTYYDSYLEEVNIQAAPVGADICLTVEGVDKTLTARNYREDGTWEVRPKFLEGMISEPLRSEHVLKISSDRYYGHALLKKDEDGDEGVSMATILYKYAEALNKELRSRIGWDSKFEEFGEFPDIGPELDDFQRIELLGTKYIKVAHIRTIQIPSDAY